MTNHAETDQLLRQTQWRIIDQTGFGVHFNALQSFGMDDTLCASVGSGIAPTTARAWVHHNTVVLGIQDTRLPSLTAGLQYLDNQQYTYSVRNSGGLAVVLDEGVLNLTLIFPEATKGMDITSGYEAMWQLIKQMFFDFPVKMEAREISGSYCPGSYDLSINGKKFAGISQRRLKKGVAVQIYLCVTGSGKQRAELIKEFYDQAKFAATTRFIFPKIKPEVMGSLSELLGVELSIADVMMRFLETLKKNSPQIRSEPLTEPEILLFSDYYKRVVERSGKMLSEQN